MFLPQDGRQGFVCLNSKFQRRDTHSEEKMWNFLLHQLSSAKYAKAWVSALLFEIPASVFVSRPQMTAWHHHACLRSPRALRAPNRNAGVPSSPPQDEQGQLTIPGGKALSVIVLVCTPKSVDALWQTFPVHVPSTTTTHL